MARINLLPWRQAERERKNREFLTIAAIVLLLSLLAAFAAWSYFNNTLDSQKQANDKIKAENAKLDTALAQIDVLEKQRNDMLAQMKVIQDLQGRRPIPVRVWDDIARLIPAQLYITNMKREGDVITFTGRADNPNVVSDFIRNLDSSQWLENSAVRSINQPQAIAYQPPTTATVENSPAGQHPVYPEDSYVIFVVTTNIAKAVTADSTTAGTAISTTSATAMTVKPIVSDMAVTSTSSATASVPPQVTSANINSSVARTVTPAISSTHTTTIKTTTTKNTISNEPLKPIASNTSSNLVTGNGVTQTSVTTTNKEIK